MQISVNLQSGRFEKKISKWGRISAWGWGNFYMQISVNLQSGRFEKKSPNWGGEFLHGDFGKSAEWQIWKKSPNWGGISAWGWGGAFCM